MSQAQLAELQARLQFMEEEFDKAQKRISRLEQKVGLTNSQVDTSQSPQTDTFDLLDDKAQASLNKVTSEAAASILQTLEFQGSKVNNPSAYVIKAVGNALKGGPSKGKGKSGEPDRDPMAELLAPWSEILDGEAVASLHQVGAQAAAVILSELESRGDTVRNPSAYVVRGCGNAQRGMVGPTVAADSARLKAEIAQWSLDEKAHRALTEVGTQTALKILQALQHQHSTGTVNNPSAYITKAVANERKPILVGPAGKRRHL